MSTLGDQLSALSSSSSPAAGFTQGGGSNNNNNKGKNRKSDRTPTLLYENSRAASEVPLSTLRDNAVAAYESLVRMHCRRDHRHGNDTSSSSSSSSSSLSFASSARLLLSQRNLDEFERGTSTSSDNRIIDENVATFASWITTLLLCDHGNHDENASNNASLESCLIVIEYLLRLYELYDRPRSASTLLIALLPLVSSTSKASIFVRASRLVEYHGCGLDSVEPRGCWTFLVPHAASLSKSSSSSTTFDRGVLATRVARDDALASIIVRMGENAATNDGSNDAGGGRGASAIISLSASILVESLYVQTTASSGGGGVGGVREGTVRAILPSILSACKFGLGGRTMKSNNDGVGGGVEEEVEDDRDAIRRNYHDICVEWRGWGRILAHALVVQCPSLGRDVKVAICDAIVDGIIVVPGLIRRARKVGGGGTTPSSFRRMVMDDVAARKGENEIDDDEDDADDDDDDASGAVLTLISVLGTMNAVSTDEDEGVDGIEDDDDDDEEWKYYLPMLPPKKRHIGNKDVVVDYMGCELPPSTYRRLSRKDGDVVAFAISSAMRADLAHNGEGREGGMDVDIGDDVEEGSGASFVDVAIAMERIAPLVASIVMHALRRLEKEGGRMMMMSSSSLDRKDDAVNDDTAGVRCRADRDVLVILGLIRETSLSPLWRARRSALVAAVTVRSIISYDRLMGQCDGGASSFSAAALMERYGSIVDALSAIDRDAHEWGVAYVVDKVVKATSVASAVEGDICERASRLAGLLNRVVGGVPSSSPGGGNSGGLAPSTDGPGSVVSLLLPARVALESADANVRLDAVARLKSEAEQYDVASEAAMGGSTSSLNSASDGSLVRALLRRLVADDNAEVAREAGSIVAAWLKRMAEGGDGGDIGTTRPSFAFAASVAGDPCCLAEEALASLMRWTYVGRDNSWSLKTSTDPRGKINAIRGKSEAKDDVQSPLLSCISICGSAARLIMDHESFNDATTRSTTNIFYALFASLGAHVIVGDHTESEESVPPQVTRDAVSQAASAELLLLFRDEGANSTVAELITEHPVSHEVLNYFFSGRLAKVSSSVPSALQSSFLWFALHSYSEVLSSPPRHETPSPALLQVTLNLILNQMQSYTKESKECTSFRREAQFLENLCTNFVSSLGVKDGYRFEQCIMDLASTSSNVSFDDIVRPAIISSQIDSLTTKTHKCCGLAALLKTCLHPNARSSGSSRLLSIAHELVRGECMNSNTIEKCIIPTLALLAHPDRAIRDNVIRLLEQFQLILKDQVLLDICNKAAEKSSPFRSSLLMDGANVLPNLLRQIVVSPAGSSAALRFLVEGCKHVVFTEEGEFASGGCEASAIILSSMEKAGEHAFSLSTRWNLAGDDLLEAFLGCDQVDLLPSTSLGRLRDCVLSMLKGVVVNEAHAADDGLNIQISIGPSQTGGRMRSYSVGGSGRFTTLDDYPDNMLQSVLKSLLSSTSPLLLSKHVIQLVIARHSWSDGVFPKLTGKSRNAITSALLTLRARDNNELAGSALVGLPLRSSDFFQMLKGVDASRSEIDQSAVVFITDCIRGKLDVLGSVADVFKLSSKLFDQLSSTSSSQNSIPGDGGSRDYTRVSILQALHAIHSCYKSQFSKAAEVDGDKLSSKRKRSRSHSDVGNHRALASEANLLVGLVGGDTSTYHPINSGRGIALSLSLLTLLCEESPSAVVTSLLPTLMNLSEASPRGEVMSVKKVDLKALGDAIIAVVPAYCKHAPLANLSLFNLLETLIGKIIVPGREHKKSTYILLDKLVTALKLLPQASSSDAIASFAACVMALQAFNLHIPTSANDAEPELLDTEEGSHGRLDARVLSNLKSGIKIGISLSLLQYAVSLMAYISGDSIFSAEEPPSDKLKVTISEVTVLALRGGASADAGIQIAAYSQLTKAQQRSVLYLAITFLQSVRDALSIRMAKQIVRKNKGDDGAVCLRLWDELMQAHTYALRAHAKLGASAMNPIENRFWGAAPIVTGDCLENLQNLLPVPHFLASVSSALESGSEVDTYIRKKSLRFLADRVSELTPDSPEASLFLEMVPDLVALIDVDRSAAVSGDESLTYVHRAIIMQQGALIAIECFVRSLYPTTENGKLATNATAVILPALSSITRLLNNTASSWIKANDYCSDGTTGVANAECQLLSSCSLCVSTIVTTLKARCLPQLPSIVKPLVAALKSVNDVMDKTQEKTATSGELLQLSILKTIKALAETLPQFLSPFLPLIFSNNALPSLALKQGAVSVAASEVETALATKVQIRQLVPALYQALSKNLGTETGNWQEATNNLLLLNLAVESSHRSDLSPIVGKILNGLVMAYGYEGDECSRPQLLMSANKCFLSLIMKLSEAQLRPLYARLREWRGDIEDKSDGRSSAVRRHAFWSLSAQLSRSLRSIFLPCLTSVLQDVIDELEIAVSFLCQNNKKSDGFKRRRVEEEHDVSSELIDKIKPLQPLLLCLESALKADAHEGGDWTRGDDNQRYKMILSHLGKLLLSQIPKETPLLSDLTLTEKVSTSAYQQLVQGVGTLEHGNVMGCLTALATAAGNEQLWKPLNFAVLEACGHKKSEVRKAGISCLLSIIETIGEEYMVLLPECLPVLSELLEDEEEIAGMAKECVRQGEELLGESLEDSLR